MGHLYHGYVSHNQRVILPTKSPKKVAMILPEAQNLSQRASRAKDAFVSPDRKVETLSYPYLGNPCSCRIQVVHYVLPVVPHKDGGSFKNREPIGEVGCCESGMAERSH